MYCNFRITCLCVPEIFVKKWMIIPQQIEIILCKIKISTDSKTAASYKQPFIFALYAFT